MRYPPFLKDTPFMQINSKQSTDIATFSMILVSLLTHSYQEKKWDQLKFFKETGFSSATWSRLMRGQSHFQIEDLRTACKVLGLKLSELIASAEEAEAKLTQTEGIKVVSKDTTKKDPNILPAVIAGAALMYLLSR
jgi:transcriptional regulator with XRE-family HTH domain